MEFLFMTSNNGLSVPKMVKPGNNSGTKKHNIFSVAVPKTKSVQGIKLKIGSNGQIQKI